MTNYAMTPLVPSESESAPTGKNRDEQVQLRAHARAAFASYAHVTQRPHADASGGCLRGWVLNGLASGDIAQVRWTSRALLPF